MTDLARMGWELHAVATFAGHRHTDSTLTYINPRELHLMGEKPQVAWSQREAEGLRRLCGLAA